MLKISAKTGEGFDALVQWLAQDGDFGRRILDIDYDTYADGEAELGWLNSSVRVTSEEEFSLDDFLLDVVVRLKNALAEEDAEAAHLKTIGLWEGFFGVANLVSSENAAELSLSSNCQVKAADVIVNARVACEPELLEELVRQHVAGAGKEIGAEIEFRRTQSFNRGGPSRLIAWPHRSCVFRGFHRKIWGNRSLCDSRDPVQGSNDHGLSQFTSFHSVFRYRSPL